ncbi:hypothetical protein GCM10017771_48800 [Streptomyces capitiformicae]|uniref:DDE Tnp4 domain-containing protein n=1 Tax=Streptomyces capitiformicae TaxID=2014920 RepID=A0A918Z0V0_9ACTN|nr:transposase family protein [Streptomyces capitiformicae]GHE32159.1 hypothetical protein GCM10017771_48800 [Streptomyces capitiformicae]
MVDLEVHERITARRAELDSAAGPDAPRRSPPAGTTTSPPICARPASAPSPTWASSASNDNDDPDVDPEVITGYKAARNRPLTRGRKLSNTVLAAVRAPVEHGFAHLKNWRILTKLRTDPKSATVLVRALLVLTNPEIAR